MAPTAPVSEEKPRAVPDFARQTVEPFFGKLSPPFKTTLDYPGQGIFLWFEGFSLKLF